MLRESALKSMNARFPALSLLFAALCLSGGEGAALAKEAKIDFAKQVKPILGSRCVNCHKSEAMFGELNLENRALAFKKRREGPVIIPGKPDSSRLFGVLYLSQKVISSLSASCGVEDIAYCDDRRRKCAGARAPLGVRKHASGQNIYILFKSIGTQGGK